VIVILMGVAGSGKTTVGRALAAEIGWPFIDGDDLHAPAAVVKMHAGVPLTDADRAPWLGLLHDRMTLALERREHRILACSALKARYRETLRGTLRGVRFVFLVADAETLTRRLETRVDHFAGPSLLSSQLADLEPPADAVTIDATGPIEEIVGTIRRELGI
jgi:gluconokinase